MGYQAVGHDSGMQFKSRQEVVDRFLEEIKQNIERYNEDPKDFSLLDELMQCYLNVFGDVPVDNGVLNIDFNKLLWKYPEVLKNEDKLFDEWNYLFNAESKYGYRLEYREGDKRIR